MRAAPLARVIRSGLEESIHRGDVAVVDLDGRLLWMAGRPDRIVFARSTMKPLQAAVSLSLADLSLTDPQVAVMCASHNAEPAHVEAVRSLLAAAGVPESALLCPAARPWEEEATAAPAPGRSPINSDCSGKHAGMLAACAGRGWPLESYREPDHPLQQEVLRWVGVAAGLAHVPVGVDGCGVPVHALPLRAMARLYARLGVAEGLEALRPHAERAVGAMRAEPYFVAGRGRVDTAVMEVASGIVVKSGAEGLICAAVPSRKMGIAVKVRDGGFRAAGPALIRVLEGMGAVGPGEVERLGGHARPAVMGGGRPVGEIVTDLDLEPGDS